MKKLTLEEVHRYSEELRTWNRWGEDNEIGTLNFVTPEKIVEAAKLITKGQTFALAIDFDANGPQTGGLGRFNPIHTMLATGVDAANGVQEEMNVQYADDILSLPLHGATHWDSLSHVFYDSYMWNGYSAELVSAYGAKKNGIEKAKDKMVGRGVLCLLDSVLFRPVSAHELGAVPIPHIGVIEHVAERIPMSSPVERKGQDVICVLYVHLILYAVGGVNPRSKHRVDGIEPTQAARLRTVGIEINGQGKCLALCNELCGLHDLLRGYKIKCSDFIVFAPTVPGAELFAVAVYFF